MIVNVKLSANIKDLHRIVRNTIDFPKKLIEQIKLLDIDEETQKQIIEVLETARWIEGRLYIDDRILGAVPIPVRMYIMALVYGSSTFGIKPQLNLKDLIVK